MSRMIPPYISEEVKSTGEKQIFEIFRKDPSTDGWVVLHSLGLAKHVKRLYGEIDFLVLAPELGIFCLEVKSGEVKREEGVWKFTNRFGVTESKSRGPFQQAQEAMYSLMGAVKNMVTSESKLPDLLYGYGVMFPHIEFPVEGTEYERWQIYDRLSRRFPISQFIKSLSSNLKKKLQKKLSVPTGKDISKLLSLLRGDFERLTTPKQRMGDIEELILSYTSEQYKYLDQLQDNERCLFQGAAGTGKTMLVIESARRSLFSNKRTLVLCYNILLGNWIKYRLEKEIEHNLIADDFHGFLTKIVSKTTAIPDSLTKDTEYYQMTLPLMALEAIDKGTIEPFDKLIIDEGQDLIRPEYLDVFDALLKGGFSGGNWEIYSDLERQAIFSKFSASDMIKMLEERAYFTKFRLKINCRNTRPIGEDTAFITGFEKPPFLPNNIEGLPVEYRFYKNREHQVEILKDILRQLKEQKIPPENISILSRYKFENSCVSDIALKNYSIEDFANKKNDPLVFVNCRNTSFSTITGFKGLENSYIIITDIIKLKDDDYKSQLYVGMSRARYCLYVLISEKCKEDCLELLEKRRKSNIIS